MVITFYIGRHNAQHQDVSKVTLVETIYYHAENLMTFDQWRLSVIAKCMERLVCNQLIKFVANRMHRVLFIDFSSAFNTIQTHVLTKKLLNLEVNPDLILWIRQFLCDRSQRVRLNGPLCRDPVLSDEIMLNTGTPQGCVLSPILFSIYMNDISSNKSFLTLIKYADDMALVGRLKYEHSLSKYLLQIDALTFQFKSSFLKPNTTKTKQLMLGGKPAKPIFIDNQEVEIVNSFKYLGSRYIT